MKENQQKHEFMSILSESHPGLTFEEYRDSCIFILFYHYLCLRYDQELEENYKLHMMVRLAIRGKLQMDSFLKFIGNASPFIHLICPEITLENFSFYKKLQEVETMEKQKSFARFIRKLIKKLDAWGNDEQLLDCYPSNFEMLMIEFSTIKKDTGIPESILALYHIFIKENKKASRKVFQPEFRYGSLLRTVLSDCEDPFYCGYENEVEYIEYMEILCFMHGFSDKKKLYHGHKAWMGQNEYLGKIDTVCIYQPEGVDAGIYLSSEKENAEVKSLFKAKTKGELPYLLSAFPILNAEGDLMAIMPSAILYREGRENQIRKYLVESMNCLDTIILLPESVFPSMGQQEVFLYMKKNRDCRDIMFFDCSEKDEIDEETLRDIRKAWAGRKSITGFCNCIGQEEIAKNDYNLNLPRYIKKPVGIEAIDTEAKKARIAEIEKELREIDAQIDMYRRDLELDALL